MPASISFLLIGNVWLIFFELNFGANDCVMRNNNSLVIILYCYIYKKIISTDSSPPTNNPIFIDVLVVDTTAVDDKRVEKSSHNIQLMFDKYKQNNNSIFGWLQDNQNKTNLLWLIIVLKSEMLKR